MGALKGLDMAAPTSLCRSNLIPGRSEWLSSLKFYALVSCCLLPLHSECATLPAGYVWNSSPEFANITGPTTYNGVFSAQLLTSPNVRNALALTIETSNTSGPICYLEVIFFSSSYNTSAPTPQSGYTVTPWTHPCPHTPLPNGNCTFAFTKSGDIQLLNSVAGRSVLLWSSNTTGLSARALGMQDYNTFDGPGGDLVLYNASSNIVWANVRDDTNFQCSGEVVTSQAATKKKISDYMLMCLVLSVGAALISFWELGPARSEYKWQQQYGHVLGSATSEVAAHKVLKFLAL